MPPTCAIKFTRCDKIQLNHAMDMTRERSRPYYELIRKPA